MVDEPDEPLVAAEWAADGPTRSLHAEAALGTRVMATRGSPSQRVALEADGALVGGLGNVGGGVRGDGVAKPRHHLGPYALDALEDGRDAAGAEPRIRLAPDAIYEHVKESDAAVRGLHVGDRVVGVVAQALCDRRQVADDRLAGDSGG